MIRIVLADDHPAMRVGMAIMLERGGDVTVVAQAATPGELFAHLSTVEWDIVITDFAMPDDAVADGLNMLSRIRRLYPNRIVIVMTMIANPVALRAIAAQGCQGMCDKAAPLAEMVEAVRQTVAGGWYRSAGIVAALEAADAMNVDAPGSQLTPKEIDVVRMIAEGMTLGEIADRLHRSNKTVSRQKRDAMKRLAIQSDEELIDYARRTGLA
ncbi:response regulator transcription factor [Stenotrophomonas sp. Sa5BUN4]|uniref:Response regulator transcription factor n=1 Tax=Stenotrophomonas lacuserhaii TaxID=2760084 RepID=A0A8X8FUZ2_9GAMM|nr:response regulator transcription factor [Stenotrophomonas pennii]MBD7954306.1 response regulator transcription factor [Stenotrophomonas pennii]